MFVTPYLKRSQLVTYGRTDDKKELLELLSSTKNDSSALDFVNKRNLNIRNQKKFSFEWLR